MSVCYCKACLIPCCRYTLVSMNVPEPVMSLAVMPKSRDGSGNFSKALNRFVTTRCEVLPAVCGIQQ